jgi:amidase
LKHLRASREVSARLLPAGGDGYDLLLCPTLSAPPPEIGRLAPDRPFTETLPLEKQHISFTPIQNMTGEPAISLPMGRTAGGLPIGVQFAAPPGGEARLLALAYELEATGTFRTLAKAQPGQDALQGTPPTGPTKTPPASSRPTG